MTTVPSDILRALALDLDPDRLAEAAAAFAEIRAEIEKLHALDLGETQPAVIFRPIETPGPDHG
jgi:hypothetical protein